MSEQDAPPPKPKPGSLRDRIAAFEAKPAAAAAAPQPRPKPGHVQWKPKTTTPPASPGQSDSPTNAPRAPAAGGMSAADAKASIGVGGSLKERMAALQGKAAFGAPTPPPPKPASDKPKWKPPVVSPPAVEISEQPIAASTPSDTEVKEIEVEKDTLEESVDKSVETPEEHVEADPEDEERQRRAAIAARMARLGGARIGMAPAVARKPQTRASQEAEVISPVEGTKSTSINIDSEVHSPSSRPDSTRPIVTSPSPADIGSAASEKKEYFDASSTSASESSAATASRSPPTSMPVPAVPRRAGPPRKKIPKAPSPAPTSAALPDNEIQSEDIPVPPTAVVDAIAPTDVPHVDVTEPTTIAAEVTEQRIVEEPVAAEVVEEHLPDSNMQESDPVKDDEIRDGAGDEEAVHDDTAVAEQTNDVPPPAVVEDEPDEEDEVTRRKRIAERIAKSGGMNPFSIPPVRQSSTSAEQSTPTSTSPIAERSSFTSPSAGRQSNSRQGSIAEEPKPTRQSSTFSASERTIDEQKDSPELHEQIRSPVPVTEPDEEIVDADKDDHALSGNSSAMKEPQENEANPLEDEEDMPSSHGIAAPRGEHELDINESRGSMNVNDASDTIEDENDNLIEQNKHEEVYHEDHEEEGSFNPQGDVHDMHEAISPARSLPPPPAGIQTESFTVTATFPEADSPKSSTRSIPAPPRHLPVLSASVDNEEAEIPSPPLRPARRSMPPPPTPTTAVDGDSDSKVEQDSVVSPEHQTTSIREYDADQYESMGSTGTPSVPIVEPPKMVSPVLPKASARRSMPPPPRALPTEPRNSDLEAYSEDFRGNAVEAPTDVRMVDEPQHEVLDEEDGDPIDPVTYRPPSRLPTPSPPQTIQTSPVMERASEISPRKDSPVEQTSRQTIADRMAKLGGIRLGAPPPISRPLRPPPPPVEQEEILVSEDLQENHDQEATPTQPEHDNEEEEEEERARKARIAAKLATMGGLRLGMVPGVPGPLSPQHPRGHSEDSTSSFKTAPSVILPAPPLAPQIPVPAVMQAETETESSDMADSEMVDEEESELEEVSFEDAEEMPPEVPSRAGRRPTMEMTPEEAPPPLPAGRPMPPSRPIVPVIPPIRRESRPSFALSEQRSSRGSAPETSTPLTDFVIVDDPIRESEELPPPPPPRVGRRPTRQAGDFDRQTSGSQPPAMAPNQSQWGLPEIPTVSLDLGRGEDLSSSAWSEDSTTYPSTSGARRDPSQNAKPLPAVIPTQQSSATSGPEAQMSADDLLALWGRVGVHVSDIAHHMHEKAKKTLVGDGTYPGFVRAVFSQVQGAAPIVPGSQTYGHLIYAQSGSTVQRRVCEIMPGDIITLVDAKLKGHKGLQSYQQNVGISEPVVGIISDFDPKKNKAKVYQANQHVGGSTVESISYRFEDMKSGALKIYRAAEA